MSMHVDPCFSLALRRADRIVTQLYNQHMAASGLRGTQYSVMRAVGDHGCVTAGDLSRSLRMDQTTVSRALKPLLRDGLLKASASPTDGREKMLCITDEGRELLGATQSAWEKAQQELRAALGEETSQQLLAVTRKIAALGEP